MHSISCTQALALRGDGDKYDSNLMLILHLRALDQLQLVAWLEWKKDKYVSPQIQNEILSVMGTTVLREIASTIRCAQYFALMVDEVTDSSNKEQVLICLELWMKDFSVMKTLLACTRWSPSRVIALWKM